LGRKSHHLWLDAALTAHPAFNSASRHLIHFHRQPYCLGGIRAFIMKSLKIVIRVILVILMIPIVIQLFGSVIGIVAAANNARTESISYMIGHFIGTFLILILLMWIFWKLGDKKPDGKL